MGWTSIHSDIKSNKDFYNHYLSNMWAPNCKVLEVSFQGNEIWELIEHPKEIFIAVTIISRKGGEVFYKTMSECAGPFYYKCPDKFLNRSTCQTESAVAWRETCKSVKLVSKSKTKLLDTIKQGLKQGDIVEMCSGRQVKFEFHHNKNRFAGREFINGKFGNLFAWRYKDIKI